MASDPEFVGEKILKDGGVTNIRKMKNLVKGGSPTWRQVQAGYMKHLLEPDLTTETIKAVDIKRKMKLMGNNAFDTIFNGRGQRKRMQKFVDVLDLVQKRGSTAGRMWIQLAQGTAAGGLLIGGEKWDSDLLKGGSALILTGPRLLAALITSNIGIKILTDGLTTPNGATDQVARLATRLAGFVAKENLNISQ